MVLKYTDYQFFKAGDLTTLAEVIHPHSGGADLGFSIAYAYLEPGQLSLLHTLEQAEVYLFVSGEGHINLDGNERRVGKGDCVVVSPKAKQSLMNTGDERLAFFCIVSPPWTAARERILSQK